MSFIQIILFSYLVLCLVIGCIKLPKVVNLRDYSLGSSNFSTTLLSITMIATVIDDCFMIGQTEKAFSLGLTFIIPTLIMQPFAWILMGKLMSKSIMQLKKQNCLSLVDIMSYFYGKWGKWACLAGFLVNLAYLSVMYKGAAFIFNYYLGLPHFYGALIIALTVGIYSIFGGIHSVLITDTLQFITFVIIFPIIFLLGLSNLDLTTTFIQVPYAQATLQSKDIILISSLFIASSIPATGLPFIQRGLMSSSSSQVSKVFLYTGIGTFIFLAMVHLVGYLVSSLDPNLKSDTALFFFIEQSIPTEFTAFAAVSLLAVIMSTASSFLNASALVVTKDFLKPLFPKLHNSNKKELISVKISSFVVAVLGLGMVFVKQHLLDLLWLTSNFWDPFVSVPLMLGLGGIRVKNGTFKFVIIISLFSLLFTRFFTDSFDTITLAVGIISSFLAMMYFRDKKSINKADPEAINSQLAVKPLAFK